jgi:hypothetical protein
MDDLTKLEVSGGVRWTPSPASHLTATWNHEYSGLYARIPPVSAMLLRQFGLSFDSRMEGHLLTKMSAPYYRTFPRSQATIALSTELDSGSPRGENNGGTLDISSRSYRIWKWMERCPPRSISTRHWRRLRYPQYRETEAGYQAYITTLEC